MGWHAARTLALAYRTLDAIQTAGSAELRRVAGIGPEIARSVRLFFEEPKNRTVLDRLFKVELKVRALRVARDGPPLRGKTFVLTGKLDHYTQAEAREKLEALGARVASSVGATIDYLVVGADPGSKVGEAKSRAIPIIKEKEFERLVS
ncbi:MAG TPA: helix-hairpin-helix domain-containing protein [Nitrospira sp.]|nr:helix-hairpin-helix domain-containing protein [Nitrospira sp.]